jgi:hypothetical protein
MALPKRRDRDTDPAGVPAWASLYEAEHPGEVAGYVKQHPSVAPLLAEAPREIAAIFGNAERPRLHLAEDPETRDSWLAVGIPVATDGLGNLSLIDALDERWWLDRMRTTDAVLVFEVVMQ